MQGMTTPVSLPRIYCLWDIPLPCLRVTISHTIGPADLQPSVISFSKCPILSTVRSSAPKFQDLTLVAKSRPGTRFVSNLNSVLGDSFLISSSSFRHHLPSGVTSTCETNCCLSNQDVLMS
jgi:hypothetical protein